MSESGISGIIDARTFRQEENLAAEISTRTIVETRSLKPDPRRRVLKKVESKERTPLSKKP